jgi:hypothetical protein
MLRICATGELARFATDRFCPWGDDERNETGAARTVGQRFVLFLPKPSPKAAGRIEREEQVFIKSC